MARLMQYNHTPSMATDTTFQHSMPQQEKAKAPKRAKPHHSTTPQRSLLLLCLGLMLCANGSSLAIAASPKVKAQVPTLTKAQLRQVRGKLKRNIGPWLKQSKLRGAKLGVMVQRLDGTVLYQHKAKQLYIPASNTKLLTIGTALHALGPHFRYKTVIYGDNPIDSKGILRGNLYIKGSGDPSLRSEEFWRIAADLKQMGLRRITGRVIFDDSYFDRKYFGKGWEHHNHHRYRPYVAGISALSLNFNTITITVRPGKSPGSKAKITIDPKSRYVRGITNSVRTVAQTARSRIKVKIRKRGVRDQIVVYGKIAQGSSAKRYWRRVSQPGWYAAFSLAAFLRSQRIRVSSWPKRKKFSTNKTILYEHQSQLLSALLQNAGKNSSNFVTEQVLKTMGAVKHDAPGTWAKGLKVMQDYLKQQGIAPNQYKIVNGSGLGRHNRFSPAQFTKFLAHLHRDPLRWPEFLVAQPIAGADGTLRRRMGEHVRLGQLRAKTGTLDGVSSLSGYIYGQNKELLVFSICMNGRLRHNRTFRRVQDQIGTLLAQYPYFRKKLSRTSR